MRLKAICCDLCFREVAVAIARSRNRIDPEFLKFSSSISAEAINHKIRSIIDNAERSNYNAVLMLICCEKWATVLNGLTVSKIPVVFPRRFICHKSLCSQPDNSDIIKIDSRDWLFDYEPDCLNMGPGRGKCDAANPIIKNNNPVNLFEDSSLLIWESSAEIEAQVFGWDFEKTAPDFSMLYRLMNGYWSYDEFFVLMPGTRLELDIGLQTTSNRKVHG